MQVSNLIKFGFGCHRVFTGIQPTGNLHLGNYLGSIQPLLRMLDDQLYQEVYLSIADYHSLTNAVTFSHAKLSYNSSIGINTFQMAKMLIAARNPLPEKLNVFVQSKVKEHVELAWILGCISPQHWLNTMIQYKDKSHQQSGLGIYSYPVLMAADILLYKASHVPVGEDQKQHLELCDRIADRFNKVVGEQFFPIPEYVKSPNPRVMSLVDPQKKMSKSEGEDRGRINLTDTKDKIIAKIKKAVTDSEGDRISYEPEQRKGLSNLMRIYGSLKNRTPSQVAQQFASSNIKIFKQALSDILIEKISHIQYNILHLSDEQVNRTLKQGEQKARILAQSTIKDVKDRLHFFND